MLRISGIALLLLCSSVGTAFAGEPLAVIVHKDSAVTNLSQHDLRAIFLRRKTKWPSGDQIRILNWTPRSSTRVAFDKAVLKMSAEQVAAYWVDQRIRGMGMPPRSIGSHRLIQGIVGRIKGFISYLPKGQLDAARVKVLRVDGKLPDDPKYPLQPGGMPTAQWLKLWARR